MSTITPERAIAMAWAVWVVSWFLAAGWSRKTVKRAGQRAERLHLWVTLAGFVMILWTRDNPADPSREQWAFGGRGYDLLKLWVTPPDVGWLLFGLTVLGFLFCWWARLHLGRLWSGTVTRKADHHIVDTGPYRLVRHPIYTGLILAAAATALEKGSYVAMAGAALVALGFWIKARLEERFLRAELGAEAYDGYAARTPMLIPHPVFGRSPS
jgi:protein-S-isoprenylcysteine O-methyltransferase Ste14